MYTDASESGLGAVLTQIKEDGLERPVAYASRTLSKSERNYDAHKLEFLALKWAITDRFHEYLYGGTFDVFMDNDPLTYILSSAKLDAVGQRWVASLGPYTTSVYIIIRKDKIQLPTPYQEFRGKMSCSMTK